ncbi:hypothetical protein SADUNF_Sadunf03G0087300 [Salix dunnii]|uniref:Histone deacetylase complex subunit SAP18 n=1 Tax=Salix dunnii TaxID=1413687 RepID=A0A835KC44_9ROSI|nr:hypothetical protein SADUNF_Sadunf03G0087300 [Salix dunnii]
MQDRLHAKVAISTASYHSENVAASELLALYCFEFSLSLPNPTSKFWICPVLLAIVPSFDTTDESYFLQLGSHHKPEDFAVRGKEPKDEVQIYTWKDATLRELTDLVKEVAPEARRRNAKLSFAFVYPDKHGRFVLRVVGMTHSSGRRPDDLKALAELNFQIGDYLDVAIM